MSPKKKVSNEIARAFCKELGVQKKLFCPPLSIVTCRPTRGKEVAWGKVQVLLKDKLGKVLYDKKCPNAEVGVYLLEAYAKGVSLCAKQEKIEAENAKI